MEGLGVIDSFWSGKKVLVTGHTGFKGGWLCAWLKELNAEVHGYALLPPTTDSFFSMAHVGEIIASSTIADIRDYDTVQRIIDKFQPEIVFHLAAQPLVRSSYTNPVETYDVNVMGVVSLFEAIRTVRSVKVVVNVTTDKCYENREWIWPYRETDALGGYDPYASSKSCSEIVTAAYRQSFLESKGVAVATARAGNVIGGGDFAVDRLLPDVFRAIESGEPLNIRYPQAIRPWQHVLEPLSGYLTLAEEMFANGAGFSGTWNFGPSRESEKTVNWIIQYLITHGLEVDYRYDLQSHPHETGFLKLDSSKARSLLNWQPRWHLSMALQKIISWYQAWKTSQNMLEVSIQQIKEYSDACVNEEKIS